MRFACQRRGISWNLDLDEGIDLSIYLFGAYEGDLLRAYGRFLKPGDVVFDIGANIGAHTLHFAKLVGPSGVVHGFEPTDYAIGKLRANLALNPDLERRVSAHQLFLAADAAAALPETVCSSWPVDRWTPDTIASGLDEQHLGKGMTVNGAKMITADHFCSSIGLEQLDLIKLDVDGNELEVLKGFRGFLTRYHPKIIIELAPFVHCSESDPESFDRLVDFLVELKYDFFEAATQKPIPSNGNGLRMYIGDGMGLNALLIPRAR
jgi:FkbM family methyltransferase